RLMYAEKENPGPTYRSEAEYHNTGSAPAQGDIASDLAHQQVAVNTAVAASIEWITKVGANPEAPKAIKSAKIWNLKKSDPRIAKELEAGMMTQLALSCAAGKWDGEAPADNRGILCRSAAQPKSNSVGAATGSQLKSEIIGLAANLIFPYALKFTGM